MNTDGMNENTGVSCNTGCWIHKKNSGIVEIT